jgi:hypothetical protein
MCGSQFAAADRIFFLENAPSVGAAPCSLAQRGQAVPRLNSRARRHRRRRRDHDISARRHAIPDHVAVRATKESPSEDSSSAISDHRRERDAEVPAGEAMRSVGFRAVATLDGEGGRREGTSPYAGPAA